MDDKVVRAAERLREAFIKAREGNYLTSGWYFYIAREDIETLITDVLGPEPVEEEPVEEPREIISVPTIPNGGTFDPDENTYTTGTGQVIVRVHDAKHCVGRGCVIHHPSDHHMKDWPTNWRTGGPFDIKPPHMERICPHGIGHPDPDEIVDGIDVHGCDGCCSPVKKHHVRCDGTHLPDGECDIPDIYGGH